MNKILLIVPDKDLQERAEAYLSHINIQDVILESTHMYGTSEALAAKFDANIVIARGITGQAIKRTHRDIHFVDIAITSDDIIAALAECKRKNGNQRIALILSDTNTTRLQQLEEVTGLSIQPYYISDEDDIRLVIEDVKSRGIHSIIGGVTVCQYCQQMGLSAIKIRTGAEAMERAINEALNAAKSINRERTKTNLLRTLLNNNRDAIIAVDSDGLVIDMNNQANLIFHLPDEKKHPLYIQDIFSDADWINTLHTGEHSERLQTIDNKLMLVNRSPILVDSHQAGVLLTFQNTEEIRETEVRIRKQLSSKGLVAHHTFEHIVAVNSVMLQRIATAKKYSQVESSVLIMGETGTGKE
ncbi:MAG TPA: hypothetical protein DEB10_14875, partial [Ruminococcaceae bacterium]|nr:hypothetical protein [Oscillospiraceae bacterium]